MRVDLHTHSQASDGSLSAVEVYRRALRQGVELLAITDHDTLTGYRQLRDCFEAGPAVVAGLELSCVWRGVGVHILGLGVSPEHAAMRFAEAHQLDARARRAEMIAARLAKAGLGDTLAAVRELAAPGQVGRPHFARHLVEQGLVADFNEAFDRYLGSGKTGDVKALWPCLPQVVGWIRSAGGVPVLAHPLKYRLTHTRLRLLLSEFQAAGGLAVEVISGRQTADQTLHMSRLCNERGLWASLGSDFHQPDLPWRELGCSGELPVGLKPVWELWQPQRERRRGAWL